MGTAWRYWTHVRLEASGRVKRLEIEPAKAFFRQQFPDYVEADDLPDLLIQRQLVNLMHGAAGADSSAEPSRLAECCLRCFVSQQIPQVCLHLERRFATQGQFTCNDLLPYVLDDVNPLQSSLFAEPVDAAKPRHQSLAVKIVHTFNPEQSNLSTWTKRLVLQQKYLNAALTECGIYLASDWSILSHTSPGRLQRLLSGMVSDAEIQRACCLLNSFHAVYRADRMQRRSTNPGQRCTEPSQEQLARMVVHLTQQGIQGYTPTGVLRELRELAQTLRQGKKMAAMSLDDENTRYLADQQQARQAEADDEDQNDFLNRYRQESEQCLIQAIQQAIDNRLAYLRSKKPPKDSQALPEDQAFLKALRLFYCEDKSMTEIAPLVGKQKQYQVTRLLKLDELRADVRMSWLFLMVDQLDVLLQDYLNSDQLQHLRQRLKQQVWIDIRYKWLLMLGNQPDVLLKDYLNQGQFLLGELIDRILNQDTTSTYTKKPSPPKPSQQSDSLAHPTAQPLHVQPKHLYARCICQYLNLLET
jgi:hypothetical protein